MYSAKSEPRSKRATRLTAGSILAAVVAIGLSANAADTPSLGQPIDDAAVAVLDVSIDARGKNLPAGSGTPEQGAGVYAAKCASCHGADAMGGEGLADPLLGGVGTLNTDAPVKTVVSYWPYATTLFDYTRRAMPLNAPMSLTNDEVYAVSAFLLHAGGVIDADAELNAQTLPAVEMPNRDGFIEMWPGK